MLANIIPWTNSYIKWTFSSPLSFSGIATSAIKASSSQPKRQFFLSSWMQLTRAPQSSLTLWLNEITTKLDPLALKYNFFFLVSDLKLAY